MDNLLNNEALIGCAAYQILKVCPCDFSKLSILLTLLTEDSIRESLMHQETLFFEDSIFKKNRPEMLDRIYLEMLPVCLNSLVILIQDGIVETENNVLKLTEKGLSYLADVRAIDSRRLIDISNSIDEVVRLTASYNASDLFKTLKLSV